VGDRNVLRDLYANADVFIHPNPREPFGIAPLEAMASGTPVVLPNAGGVLTYATGTNAWLAAPDGAAFAEAVLGIGRDRREASRRPAAARRTAESFSWDHATSRMFDLYDRLHADRLADAACPRDRLSDPQLNPLLDPQATELK
jgi:glycosyltransferase involved in cell wall biosynthesis